MKICINGIIREMTAEEEAQYNEMAAREAAEAKHRPISENEVMSMLIKEQINTLSVDDATAVRMTAFYPEWAKDTAYTVGAFAIPYSFVKLFERYHRISLRTSMQRRIASRSLSDALSSMTSSCSTISCLPSS